MAPELFRHAHLPLDKSWLMRMGLLDIVHGRDQIKTFLRSQTADSLGMDLRALLRSADQWQEGAQINVGESGTLYRFLLFASWKLGMSIGFNKEGTLKDRKLTVDDSIIHLSIDELLELDAQTSQWASAAVLLGGVARPAGDLPYHLAMTFDAKKHWEERVSGGHDWLPRKDATIARQAHAYELYKSTDVMNFVPIQSEDYCFARAFNLISAEEGERRWPSLRQHESDRIAEMERLLGCRSIDSHDHRIVQAFAMLGVEPSRFIDPACVSKTWPQFWRYLDSFKSPQS